MPAETNLERLVRRLEGHSEKLEKTLNKSTTFEKTGDIVDSQDFKNLQQDIKELDELGQEEREALSKMAKQNNVANNLQIIKEVATFRSERDAQKNVKKSLGKLTTNVENQKKHNKGAAKSRMRIEEQNEEILKLLKQARGSGGGGADDGPGGGGGPGPGPGGGGSGGGGGGSGGGGGGNSGGGGGGGRKLGNRGPDVGQNDFSDLPEGVRKTARGIQDFKQERARDRQGQLVDRDSGKETYGSGTSDERGPDGIDTATGIPNLGQAANERVVDSQTGKRRQSTAKTYDSSAVEEGVLSDSATRSNQNNMRKLAIGGRGLVRAETDSSGELKFRKESEAETLGLGRGGGQYTTAQAYEESEFRIQQLSGAIKEGIGAGGKARATRDRGASMASKAASTMSQALADNAGDIQMAMEKSDPKAKDEMKEFSKLLAARQKMTDSKIGGQDKEKAKELDIKIQKSKMRLEKFGEGTDLAQKLNLEQVGKDLESEQGMSTLGGFIPLNKTGLKDFAGVDSSTEGFMGGLKEAFDPNRLFGAGSGFAKIFGAKESDAIQEQVDTEFAQQDQMEGFQDAIGEDLLQLTGEETKVTQENIDKNTDRVLVFPDCLVISDIPVFIKNRDSLSSSLGI